MICIYIYACSYKHHHPWSFLVVNHCVCPKLFSFYKWLYKCSIYQYLVGGFNPLETYHIVKLEIFPNFRDENKQYLKPPSIYTWNPNDPCFDWKRHCFEGWPSKLEVIWVPGIIFPVLFLLRFFFRPPQKFVGQGTSLSCTSSTMAGSTVPETSEWKHHKMDGWLEDEFGFLFWVLSLFSGKNC